MLLMIAILLLLNCLNIVAVCTLGARRGNLRLVSGLLEHDLTSDSTDGRQDWHGGLFNFLFRLVLLEVVVAGFNCLLSLRGSLAGMHIVFNPWSVSIVVAGLIILGAQVIGWVPSASTILRSSVAFDMIKVERFLEFLAAKRPRLHRLRMQLGKLLLS